MAFIVIVDLSLLSVLTVSTRHFLSGSLRLIHGGLFVIFQLFFNEILFGHFTFTFSGVLLLLHITLWESLQTETLPNLTNQLLSQKQNKESLHSTQKVTV